VLRSGIDSGSFTLNVVPLPYTLATLISPPIISQNCFVIASPSPVPPYFHAVCTSACVKGWNIFSI
jgi:hypothetical protein